MTDLPKIKERWDSYYVEWIMENANRSDVDCVRWPFSNEDWYHSVNVAPGKWSKAHRLMCESAHGSAPKGHYALHSCGKKWCVNPSHLRWGTPSENINDSKKHGTLRFGSRSAAAKLTERDVLSAREDRKKGMTYQKIGEKYGVTRGSIWHAINGSQWGHVK